MSGKVEAVIGIGKSIGKLASKESMIFKPFKFLTKLGIGGAVVGGASMAGGALSSFLSNFGKDKEEDPLSTVSGGRDFSKNGSLKEAPRESFNKFKVFTPFTIDKTKTIPLQIDQIVKEINTIKKSNVDDVNNQIKREKVMFNAIYERFIESDDSNSSSINKSNNITKKVDGAIATMLKTFGLLMAAKYLGTGFGDGEGNNPSGAVESPIGKISGDVLNSTLYAAALSSGVGTLKPEVINSSKDFMDKLSKSELDELKKSKIKSKGSKFFKDGKQITLKEVQSQLKKSKVGLNKKAAATVFSDEIEKVTAKQLKKASKASAKEFLLKFGHYPLKIMKRTVKFLGVVGMGFTALDIADRFMKSDYRGALASAFELLLAGTTWASAIATVFTGGASATVTVASIMAIIGLEVYKLKRDIFFDYYGVLPESLSDIEYDQKFDELYPFLMEAMYDYALDYFKGTQTKDELKNTISLDKSKLEKMNNEIEDLKKRGSNREATMLSMRRNELKSNIDSNTLQLSQMESSNASEGEAFTRKPSDKDLIAGANNEDTIELVQLTTASGKRYTVAKKYAENFKGFVGDLEATGYKINSIGGYSARRNVNRSSVLSDHAFGAAIDINEANNPNRDTKTDLPPETGALAAKWGLGWGMNWKNVKDPMHFSMDSREGGSGERTNIRGPMPKAVMAKSDTITTVSSAAKPIIPQSTTATPVVSQSPSRGPQKKEAREAASMTPSLSPNPNRNDLDKGMYFSAS